MLGLLANLAVDAAFAERLRGTVALLPMLRPLLDAGEVVGCSLCPCLSHDAQNHACSRQTAL
jgi:hypothetical protein